MPLERAKSIWTGRYNKPSSQAGLQGIQFRLFLEKVKGLSAGRVQSVALKLIIDREKQLMISKPEDIGPLMSSKKGMKQFRKLYGIDGKEDKSTPMKNQLIAEHRQQKILLLKKVERKERRFSTSFTTSSVQMDAANKISFVRKTAVVLLIITKNQYRL